MQLGLIIYDKWWIRRWVRTVKPPLSCHPRGTSKWPRVSHRSCHKLWIVIFNWAETSLYFKTITEREQHYRSSIGRHLLIFFIIFLKIKPNLVYQVLDGRLIVKSSGSPPPLPLPPPRSGDSLIDHSLLWFCLINRAVYTTENKPRLKQFLS